MARLFLRRHAMDKNQIIKRINTACLFALALCFAVVFITPVAEAASCKNFISMIRTVQNGVASVFLEVFTATDVFSQLVGTEAPTHGGIKAIYNVSYTFGILFCCIYGFVNFFDNAERGMEEKEALIRSGRQIATAIAIMMALNGLLGTAAATGETIAAKAIEATSEDLKSAKKEAKNGMKSDDTIDKTTEAILLAFLPDAQKDDKEGYTAGMLDVIGAQSIFIIPWAMSALVRIAAYFQAYSILLEIALRRAFAPLAVANTYGEGLHSPGMRYLLKYFAAYLKIAIALSACAIGAWLMQTAARDLSPDGVDNALMAATKLVAINFTVIGVIAKGSEIANDAAGV